jgi:3-hydroxyacyl-CoA dehydrogenase
MGAGIAAHVANTGYPVLLLDIVPPDLADAATAGRAGLWHPWPGPPELGATKLP